MAKQNIEKNTKSKNTPKKKNAEKKSTAKIKNTGNKSKKKTAKFNIRKLSKKKVILTIAAIIFLSVLLIFSSYAWFSTSLNVKVKTFNVIVTRNSGLSISLDAVNFDTSVEMSYDSLITNLKRTYPNNKSHWAGNGLTPVSSNGISNPRSHFFDIYSSSGVRYYKKNREKGYITTGKANEDKINPFSNFIAFDLFFKNVTGSPVSDNLYLEYGTELIMDSDSSEEMQGLVNSARIGFVKVGSLPLTATPNEIQNMTCSGNCNAIIYEPNSTAHTALSIERAQKYGVTLIDGNPFPTFACVKGGGPIWVEDTVSGSPNLDYNYFALQKTITEDDFGKPLFTVPDGITKVRVYVWIEGQDIDSLETDSDGADISISINFIKDTQGYWSFD